MSYVQTIAFKFRRRCGWCGVQLRGWQVNLCRVCNRSRRAPWAGPPTGEAYRWDQTPDKWIWWWQW